MKNKLLVSLNVLLLMTGCANFKRPDIKKHSQDKGDKNRQNNPNKTKDGKPLPNSTLDTFIKFDSNISKINTNNDNVVYKSVSRLLKKDEKTGKLTHNSKIIKYKAKEIILKQTQTNKLDRLIKEYENNTGDDTKKVAIKSFLTEMYGEHAPNLEDGSFKDDAKKFYNEVVIKKHSISDRHTNIGEFLNIYDKGKYDDGGDKSYTGGYTKAVSDLQKLKDVKLPEKTSTDFSDTQAYVDYLKTLPENKSITANTNEEYINKVEKQYVDKYKSVIGKVNNNCSYNDLRSGLTTKTNTQTNIVTNIEAKLLEKYKKDINPDYKGDKLPEALKAIIEELKNEDKILEAIVQTNKYKDFNLLPKLEKGLSISAVSFMDDNPGDVAKYTYDPATNNYILELKETVNGSAGNRTNDIVKFNVSDFHYKTHDKDDKYGYYKASKSRAVTQKEKVSTFMKNVKKYIIDDVGFDNTLEQEARRNKLQLALEKIRRGNASQEEKEFVKTVLGDDINNNLYGDWTSKNYSELNDKDKSKLDFLIDVILKNKITSFDIYKQKEIVNTVKLGGRALNLSYSDFGIWKIKGGFNFIGNKTLIEKAKEWGEDLNDEAYEDYYTFHNGIDKYKRGFDPTKAVGAKTVFTGTTMAVATLTKVSNEKEHKEFNGQANMIVDSGSGKAEVGLDYKNWYKFIFKEIDVKNPGGFESINAPEIHKNAGDSKFKFKNLTEQSGEIKGQMYGIETGKPEEAVGSFKINHKPHDSTYNSLTVDGVFGVKK